MLNYLGLECLDDGSSLLLDGLVKGKPLTMDKHGMCISRS